MGGRSAHDLALEPEHHSGQLKAVATCADVADVREPSGIRFGRFELPVEQLANAGLARLFCRNWRQPAADGRLAEAHVWANHAP